MQESIYMLKEDFKILKMHIRKLFEKGISLEQESDLKTILELILQLQSQFNMLLCDFKHNPTLQLTEESYIHAVKIEMAVNKCHNKLDLAHKNVYQIMEEIPNLKQSLAKLYLLIHVDSNNIQFITKPQPFVMNVVEFYKSNRFDLILSCKMLQDVTSFCISNRFTYETYCHYVYLFVVFQFVKQQMLLRFGNWRQVEQEIWRHRRAWLLYLGKRNIVNLNLQELQHSFNILLDYYINGNSDEEQRMKKVLENILCRVTEYYPCVLHQENISFLK